MRDDEQPVILPIEAKAAPDAINRVQISAMAVFAAYYFPGHEIRPIALKVDDDSLVHLIEFNLTSEPAELRILRSASYRIVVSPQQLELLRLSQPRKM